MLRNTLNNLRQNKFHKAYFVIALLMVGAAIYAISTYRPSKILATVYTWDGGGTDANWSTKENWNTDTVPLATDSVNFDNTCVTNCNPTIDAGFQGTVVNFTMAATFSGTITVSRTLTITGDYSQSNGTLTAGANIIYLAGGFANAGGTFTAGTSTVILNGAGGSTQTFSGSTTFYNLIASTTAARTIALTSGSTQTISNTAFFSGASGNLLSIASTSAGNAATLTYSGTKRAQVTYGNITDINTTPSSTWYYDSNSTKNSGTGWTSGSKVKAYGASGGNWSAAANWIGGVKPVADDDVILDVLSGNVALDESSANLRSIDMTSYAGTVSGSSGLNVVSGLSVEVKLAGTITVTGSLSVQATGASGNINLYQNTAGSAPRTIFTNGKVTLQTDITLQPSLLNSFQVIGGSTYKLDLNGHKIIGSNNTTQRGLLKSSVIGTSADITNVTATSFQNMDFMDLNFSPATPGDNLDFSNMTGLSGDAGGNSITGAGTLTLTAAATQTWTGQTGNYSDSERWGNYLAGANAEAYSGSQDDGTSDTITYWSNTLGDGKVESTATAHGGTAAIKNTSGAGANTSITQTINAIPGTGMTISFWTRGDGASAGRYRVRDLTNAADIIAITSTGVSGTTYTQISTTFTVPANCVSILLYLYSPSVNGGVAYYDDAYIGQTSTISTQRVPLPQDTVLFKNFLASKTVTFDVSRIGKDIDCSAVTNSPTIGTSAAATQIWIFGSLTLSPNMTWNTANFSMYFTGRGTHTITSASKTFVNGVIVQSAGGSYTQLDALSVQFGFNINGGTYSNGAFTLSCGSFINGTGPNKTMNGTGAITITGNIATTFNINSSGLTWNNTSDLNFTYNGVTSTVFNFGTSRTIPNKIFITGGGAGVITMTAATAATFTGYVTVGAPKSLKFTSGVTYNFADLQMPGTSGNLITLAATSGGSAATLNFTGTKREQVVYGSVTDINVTPANTWYRDPSNTTITTSTGWVDGVVVKTFGAVAGNWSDATKWIGGVAPIAQDDIIFDASSASCVVDANTLFTRSLDMTGYTGTLSGGSVLYVYISSSITVDVKLGGTITATNLYMAGTAASSVVRFTSNGRSFVQTGFTGLSGGRVILQDDYTMPNNIGSNLYPYSGGTNLDLNGHTISGYNATTARGLMRGHILGTSAGIVVNGGHFANMDFSDIGFSNGGSDLNLSAMTGLSGDVGGNSMVGGGVLTFTGTATQTWNGTTGNWSDSTKWTSRVPLPQDDVVLAGTNTATANMARLGKSISFTGATPLALANAVASYGNINFTNAGAFSGAYVWTFGGRSAYNLTSAGKTFLSSLYISGASGTLTAQDATSVSASLYMTKGSFDHGAYPMSCGSIAVTDATNVLSGSGPWTVTGNTATTISYTAGTWSDTGDLNLTYSGASDRAYVFGTSKTFSNNITITGAGAGVSYLSATTAVTFTGRVTVNAPKTVKFTSGVTYNFNGPINFNSSAGNLITIVSSTGGAAATWSKASGTVFIDYASIQDIAATGGATWYVTANVTQVSGDSGFTTTTPNGIWDGGGGANTNWSTATNWSNDALPDGNVDTFFAGTTTNATIDAGFAGTVKSLTLAGSYANTITSAKDLIVSNDVSLNGGTLSPVSYAISVGGNWARTGGTFTAGTSTVNMSSTSTGKTFTSGGQTYYNLTFVGVGGGWTLQDDLTMTNLTSILTLTSGTLDTNNKTLNIGRFNCSGTGVRTITLGASNITLTKTGAGTATWDMSTATNLTVTANTANITFTGTGIINYFGIGKVYGGTVTHNGAGNQIRNASTFNNFVVNGAADINSYFSFYNGQTVTGTLTINGNSTVNRIHVYNAGFGSASVVVTAAHVSFSNADFMNITAAGAVTPWTGTSMGDCGGNTLINFDEAVTQTWNGTTGNWSDATKWTSRIPLPQDDVILTGTNTVTLDMARAGKNISFSGATPLTLSNGVYGYGSLNFTGAGTFTPGTNTWYFTGRDTANLTSAGKIFYNLGIYQTSSKVVALDATNVSWILTVGLGEFDAGTYNLSVGNIATSNGVTMTGSGPIAMSGNPGGTIWNLNTSAVWNMTGDVTINSVNVSGRAINFGTSRTIPNNISINGTATGGAMGIYATTSVTFTGLFKLGAPRSYPFTSGTTYNFSDISINGSAGNVITLYTATPGSAATFNYTGTKRGQVVYGSITDINATPASTWYYDTNSTISNSTGWTQGVVVKTFGTSAGNWSDGTKWFGGIKPAAGDDVVFDANSASCAINENTENLRSFDASTYAGTMTGTSTLTVAPNGGITVDYKLGGTWSHTGIVSSYPGGSSTVNFASNGKTPTIVTFSGASNSKTVLQDNLTMANSVGAYVQTTTVLTGLYMNGKTISGANATTGRLLVKSSTIGTRATILLGGGSFANADFMDIGFSNGGADLNLSAMAGLSGDAGGNAMIGGGNLTFTDTVTQTWDGTTGGWSDIAKWSGGRTPLPQDDVVLTGTNTVTANMSRLGKSISFTGATPLTLSNDVTSYGSLDFTGSGTFTQGGAGANIWSFGGRGNYLLTSAGKDFSAGIAMRAPGGKLTAQDNTSISYTITHQNGELDFGTYPVLFGSYNISDSAAAKTVSGSGTITITGTNSTSFSIGASQPTWNHTGSMNLTYSSTAAKTYNFGTSRTIPNNITITGSGSGVVTIAATTAATFTGLITVNAPKTVKFTSGVTYNFAQKPVIVGSNGNLITLAAVTPSSPATLNYSGSGLILAQYADITDINVTPSATWYYDGNSSWHSGTGWSTDTTAPSVTVVVNPASPNGSNGWYTGSAPTITLSATDGGSGLASITYRWNSDANQTYSAPLTAPVGTNTLTYFATDNIGNATTPATSQYKVDLAAPTTDIYVSPTDPNGTNGWYKTTPSVTFGVTDTESGLQSIYYRWGAVGDFTLYSTAIAPAQGTNTVYYYGLDLAGNQSSTFNRTFKLDYTIPTAPAYVGVTPTGYSSTNHFEFSWPIDAPDGAADTGTSGLAKYQYRIGSSGSWTDIAGDATTATLTLDDAAALGLNTFNLVSVDNAGNQSNSVRTNFYFNNAAPTAPPNLSVNPDTVSTVNSFSFSWGASSGEIAGYYYSVNAIPTLSNAGWTTGTSLNAGAYATQQGQNIMYVVAKDSAGNYDFSGCSQASVGYSPLTDTCAAVAFTINTPAPGLPLNLQAFDISNRATSEYTVALKWDAPTDLGVGFSGYDIYRGTDGLQYSKIGTTTGTSYADNSVSSTVYFYKIKSKDNAGQYSALTDYVQIIPTGRFTSPPTLVSGPTFVINPTSIIVTWATDREASSFVSIKNGNTFVAEQGQTEQATNHQVKVVGLKPQNEYTFNIRSTDIDGNSLIGADQTFATANTPSIYDLTLSNLTQSSVIINFKSTATANFTLYYGDTADFGKSVSEPTGGATTNHSIALTGLNPGQGYFYRILGNDADGNEMRTENSFATLPMPAIEKFVIEPVKDAPTTTLKVTWKSNVGTTTILKYSADGANYSETSTDALVADHEIIVDGLADSSKYTIYGAGRDQFGNMAESDRITFNTPSDSRPPEISNVIIETSNVGNETGGKAQLAISWTTDEASSSMVEYGEGLGGEDYSKKTLTDNTLTNHHLVIISELDPGKPYHLRVVSADMSGNISLSSDNTVITGEVARSALQVILNTLLSVFGWMGRFVK